MSAGKLKPGSRAEVTVEIDGVTHTGSFVLNGSVVEVTYDTLTKSIAWTGAGARIAARQVLRELVSKATNS